VNLIYYRTYFKGRPTKLKQRKHRRGAAKPAVWHLLLRFSGNEERKKGSNEKERRMNGDKKTQERKKTEEG